jgi:dATP pyrophosphohydrolase
LAPESAKTVKLPVSVLVVVHTTALEVLLLERASRPGYWQSVTGSLDWPDEPLADAALREVREETGIEAPRPALRRWNVTYTFEIYAHWRHRFAPGVTHNVEHAFALELPATRAVVLAQDEHTAYQWLPWPEAAKRCFSWSNRDAIRMLSEHAVLASISP